MIYTASYASPLGQLSLASDGTSLTGLWVEGQKYYAATLKEPVLAKEDLPLFQLTRDWLDAYFAGDKVSGSQLPLAPAGSDFRQLVWQLLCQIPYGQTITYGGLAKKLAASMGRASMSSQAVGGAVGHNPISIIIPCHRVVGANGSLTGYASGLDRKILLLELEGVDLAGFFRPEKGTAL
jgi:methylated-DNA-[protein]-cysteine S-methyltransferase